MGRLVTAASAVSLFLSAMNPVFANSAAPGNAKCSIPSLSKQVGDVVDHTGRIDNRYLTEIGHMDIKNPVVDRGVIILLYSFKGANIETHYRIGSQETRHFIFYEKALGMEIETESETADSVYPWKYVINFKSGGTIIYLDPQRDGINGNETINKNEDVEKFCAYYSQR